MKRYTYKQVSEKSVYKLIGRKVSKLVIMKTKMKSSIILELYILLLLFASFFMEIKSALKVSGLTCRATDKQFVEFKTCEIKAINRETYEASLYVTVLKKPITQATITTKLFRRGFEHQKPFINYNTDACTFLSSRRRNPLSAMMFKLVGLECCSNINHSCPINHDLILDKYRWNNTSLKVLPLPSGNYVLHSYWYTVKRFVGQTSLYFGINDI